MTIHSDIALSQIRIIDSTMAYREAGDLEAPVALFLHGNPTSSYIWRNILPFVAPVTHCIAPDLIGFGQSGKPDIEYRFSDHVRYLDAFLEQAGITSAGCIFNYRDSTPSFGGVVLPETAFCGKSRRAHFTRPRRELREAAPELQSGTAQFWSSLSAGRSSGCNWRQYQRMAHRFGH